MSETDLIRLIESHSAGLATIRQEMKDIRELVQDDFQTLNWKLDRLVEIVDNVNNREHIAHRRH